MKTQRAEERDTIFRLRPGVLYADAEEELVLLDYDAGRYLGLKGSARHVLGLLREGASLNAMIGELVRVCEVDEAEARHDLTAILTALETENLIRRLES